MEAQYKTLITHLDVLVDTPVCPRVADDSSYFFFLLLLFLVNRVAVETERASLERSECLANVFFQLHVHFDGCRLWGEKNAASDV